MKSATVYWIAFLGGILLLVLAITGAFADGVLGVVQWVSLGSLLAFAVWGIVRSRRAGT